MSHFYAETYCIFWLHNIFQPSLITFIVLQGIQDRLGTIQRLLFLWSGIFPFIFMLETGIHSDFWIWNKKMFQTFQRVISPLMINQVDFSNFEASHSKASLKNEIFFIPDIKMYTIHLGHPVGSRYM